MTTLDMSKTYLVRSGTGPRSGIFADTLPGIKISMQVLTIAPGQEAEPGNGLDTETAGYVVSGRAVIRSGQNDHTELVPGDFYFTPVETPYLIRNPYAEPLVVVLGYSLDPSITYKPANAKPQKPGITVVPSPKDTSTTAQTRGMVRVSAISAETVGATQIWMCYLSVVPHERGQAHHHGDTHTIAYTISGRANICWGENFNEHVALEAGDFAFDPPYLVHLVDHPYEGEAWKGVLARCPQNTVVNFGQ